MFSFAIYLFSFSFCGREKFYKREKWNNILEFAEGWSWHNLQIIGLTGICPSISHIHRFFFSWEICSTHWSCDEPLFTIHYQFFLLIYLQCISFYFFWYSITYTIIFWLLLSMLAAFILSLALWNDNDL